MIDFSSVKTHTLIFRYAQRFSFGEQFYQDCLHDMLPPSIFKSNTRTVKRDSHVHTGYIYIYDNNNNNLSSVTYQKSK